MPQRVPPLQELLDQRHKRRRESKPGKQRSVRLFPSAAASGSAVVMVLSDIARRRDGRRRPPAYARRLGKCARPLVPRPSQGASRAQLLPQALDRGGQLGVYRLQAMMVHRGLDEALQGFKWRRTLGQATDPRAAQKLDEIHQLLISRARPGAARSLRCGCCSISEYPSIVGDEHCRAAERVRRGERGEQIILP